MKILANLYSISTKNIGQSLCYGNIKHFAINWPILYVCIRSSSYLGTICKKRSKKILRAGLYLHVCVKNKLDVATIG